MFSIYSDFGSVTRAANPAKGNLVCVWKSQRLRHTLLQVKLTYFPLPHAPSFHCVQFFIRDLFPDSTSFLVTRVAYILRLMIQTWSDFTAEKRFRQGQGQRLGGRGPVGMSSGPWEKQKLKSRWKRRHVWTGTSQPGFGIACWDRLRCVFLTVQAELWFRTKKASRRGLAILVILCF